MSVLPIKVPVRFRIIAHRGASAYAPENTLAAFRLAKKMGAAEVELDIQFSKDKKAVICHDKHLDRYGYPGQWVRELTLENLLEKDMGSWFSPYFFASERMLSFENFLSIFLNHFTYHVELKFSNTNLTSHLVKIILEKRLLNQVIFTSFQLELLKAVKEILPEARIGWLIKQGGFTLENIKKAKQAYCFQICPPASETTSSLVSKAHADIPEVRTHSVKGIPDILHTIEAGCDGLTTNWPDWLTHNSFESEGK